MESTMQGTPESTNELEEILHREAIKEAGLDYISKRLSIIPIGLDKRPLIKWEDYNDRIATPEEFLAWTEKFPDMQLGMVTGNISKITVLDIETGGMGQYNDIPSNCPIYKTGKGGEHRWCLYEPRAKTGVRLREFLDVRNDRAYVIVPPSKSQYGSYEWKQKIPPMVYPEFLLPQKPSYSKQTVVYGQVEDYEGCGEGGRNDSMTRYAGKILPQYHPLDWDTDAWDKFYNANLKNNPPLEERELRTIWESIKSKEKANPSLRVSSRSPDAVKAHNPDDDYDNEIVTIEEAASCEEINTGEPIPTGIRTLDDALHGGIRPGDLIVVSGQSGEGKTTLSQTITANIAELAIPVIFFTYEVLVGEILDKFSEMKIKVPGMIYTPRKHKQNTVSWVHERIKQAKEKNGVKVVVIDHLEFLTTDSKDKNVNLNFSNKVSETVKAVKNIARIEEIPIILLFHLRKINQGRPTLNDAKDSISIVQEADVGLIIERKRNDGGLTGMEFYSPTSVLSLQKNRRKGGKTCYIEMSMLQGRLVEIGTSPREIKAGEEVENVSVSNEGSLQEILSQQQLNLTS